MTAHTPEQIEKIVDNILGKLDRIGIAYVYMLDDDLWRELPMIAAGEQGRILLTLAYRF